MATPDPLTDAVLLPIIDTIEGSEEVCVKDPELLDEVVRGNSINPQGPTRLLVVITGLSLFIMILKY